MRCRLKDSSLYLIACNKHMLHLGTITRGFREFVVMLCVGGPHSGKCYIEELSLTTKDFSDDIWGNFKFIDDDNLAHELAMFAQEKGLLDMEKRLGEMIEKGLLT